MSISLIQIISTFVIFAGIFSNNNYITVAGCAIHEWCIFLNGRSGTINNKFFNALSALVIVIIGSTVISMFNETGQYNILVLGFLFVIPAVINLKHALTSTVEQK